MIYNKYDIMKLDTLIRTIQENTVKFSDPRNKKRVGAAFVSKQMKELREMKGSVISRLMKMDRFKPEFFPIRCMVLYKALDGWGEPEHGTVQGYDGDKVILKLDAKPTDLLPVDVVIKVEPGLLTMKHIRVTY